ncbi:MAG: hypothetical protein ABIV48_00785 [Pyrinomonadaceae bacterium]
MSVFIGVHLWLIFLSSCSTKPTDLRTLVPSETLVYFETNDLAAALQPIVDSKPFTEVAKSKPDFSALKGVQLAIAVTGFETTEEKLTDETSVGRVQPRFVAIADTHAWNFQAVGFAEQKLGSFVADIYHSEPTLEKTEKNGGTYFIWTAVDGRKAYALVIGSLIYFSNDETAIDKCLAVKNGEADSILKTGKILPSTADVLASGYVSTDGVAQIANIVGMKFASEVGEDPDAQSAIAGILPQLLQSSITEVGWTATLTDQGIEDKFVIGMPSDISTIFFETMAPSDSEGDSIHDALPTSLDSVSIYKLKNPQIALRSLLLVVGEKTNPLVGKIFAELVSITFENYGISDPEKFLGSLGSSAAIARFDSTDQAAIIASIKDQKTSESSISENAKPLVTPTLHSRARLWTEDGQSMSVVFEKNRILIGDERVVTECGVAARDKRPSLPAELFRSNGSSIVSTGKDVSLALPIIAILARKGHGDARAISTYTTETRFTKTGMERRTVSDFGFIGWMIAQMAQD